MMVQGEFLSSELKTGNSSL